MNQKEISEIRRRLAPEKTGVSRLYGCYVNGKGEIITQIDESLGMLSEFEVEKFMGLFRRALSGQGGKNLLDVVFSTEQVQDSDEHRLLMALRESKLEDGELREQFYQKVIPTLQLEDNNYLILLAADTYDVPYRAKDGQVQADASDGVYRFFQCAICPVKDSKSELGYFAGDSAFHSCPPTQIVSPPELGFLFPAFDDRTSNIYNALFYTRDPAQLHQDFMEVLFHIEPPMSAVEQKESFREALAEALDTDCSLQVVQTVHAQLRERMEQHKESKDSTPLTVSPHEVAGILQSSGIPVEKLQAFQEKCTQTFGQDAALTPANIIDSKKFELVTPQVKISVDPSFSYMVETRIIDGRRYVLIPADEGVEINGLDVKIVEPEPAGV